MSNKTRGLVKEREVKKILQEKGYEVSRSRGSFGLFDVMGMNSEEILLIQVKRVKGKYYSFNEEIKEIREFKDHPACVRKELWIWLDRMKGRSSQWVVKEIKGEEDGQQTEDCVR